MSTILIKNVLHDRELTDVLIQGNRFSRIAPAIEASAEKVIDGSGMAILPPYYNLHSHAAMTLLRGYADDMELFTWLNDHIWPIEARMTDDDVYIGTKLAALEMIKSGTVFFSDMYWRQSASVRAAEELKIRMAVGVSFIGGENGKLPPNVDRGNYELLEASGDFSDRIQLTVAPHAVYTVPEDMLRKCGELAEELDVKFHIHLSETRKEVDDCRAAHRGLSPAGYLAELGLLNRRLIAAHCVAFDDADRRLFAEAGAAMVHNPCSNLKLNSGIFALQKALDAGCRVAIGTDGCASNNNLSMIEETKVAALLAKYSANSPEAGRAADLHFAATRAGAEIYGLDAGVIAEGKLADAILVNLNTPCMCGGDLISDMVYSADPTCVDTVICDGNVLMEHRKVDGEEEIVSEAQACRMRLTGK